MTRLALLAAAIALPAAAQDWKPAPSPLMTRWGKAVAPGNVHLDYPRPTLVRNDWRNLNGQWQFAAAKQGEAPPTGKDLAESILVPFPVESALSGLGRHESRMWYRRTFEVPRAWKGKQVVLHLDAVDWEANVWVNGKQVGTHRGGYDRISLDITSALKPAGPQELIVGVWDPTDANWQPRGKQVLKPEGIWYTPTSGIWQTVWIEPVSAGHLVDVLITADPSTGAARLYPRFSPEVPQGAELGADVYLEGRRINWTHEYRRGDVRVWADVSIPLPEDRKLWTPDTPTLYEVRLVLSAAAPGRVERVVIDEATTYFALRSIDIAPDDGGTKRIALNGQSTLLVGPLDQGFWPDGLYTPPSDEAMVFDIESMKKLGFNAVRKHVKVEPERWYYHCDRLGLLVLQDMPSGDRYIGGNDPDIVRTPESDQQFNTEITRLVQGFGKHPSIIGWVVFNEGWGQSDTAKYTDLVKKLDPSRLVISASGWTDRGSGDIFDLHTYPGPGPIPPEDAWKNRAIILGEFGGLGLGIDGHTWQDKTWGYKGATDRDDLTMQYVELLRRLWALKEQGLSAGIYTQLTDVEGECNGLLTYDREVVKVDADRVARANRGLFPRVHPVLAASQSEPATWRYTLTEPTDGWEQPGFDDSAWSAGPAGFGTRGTPGAIVRTEWSGPEIWLRRSFELTTPPTGDLVLTIHHDEDAEIYLNGVLAAKTTGYTTDYTLVPIRAEAAAALKPGTNTLAIHCRQTRGGQYIDVGLAQLIEKDE